MVEKSKLKFSFKIFVLVVFLMIIFFGPQVKAENKPFENSHFIETEGVKLHYRLYEPEGEVRGKILLVHGLGGSTYCWRETAEPLRREGYLVVSVDLPAFGYSDRSSGLEHSSEKRAEWLLGLLDHLEENKIKGDIPWTFIGHSMGAKSVTKMAQKRVEETAGLVYIGGAIYNDPPQLFGDVAKYQPFELLLKASIDKIILSSKIMERALNSAYGRELTEEEIEAYVKPLQRQGTARAWFDVLKSNSPAPKDLSQFDIPALLVWGEKDSWVPPEDGKRLVDEMPEARLEIIPGEHHMPMVTAPDQVNEIIIEFIGEIYE